MCVAGVDLADAVVAGVGDEQVSGGVHRDAIGPVQFGGGGLSAVAAIAQGSVAGDGGNDARGGVDLADAVVVGVGDEQVAAGVHRDAAGESSSAAVAGHRRRCSLVPSPATVVMTRVLALTSRMRLLQLSAMNRLPPASTAMPVGIIEFGGGGRSAVAAVAVGPLPATVVMMPVAAIDLADAVVVVSAMNRSPLASTATPSGHVQFGVGGLSAVAAIAEVPLPATVVMMPACWR